jgi:hypothetical protein
VAQDATSEHVNYENYKIQSRGVAEIDLESDC